MNPLIVIIQTIVNVLSLMIIADALMSFFLAPDHPVREALGRILNPLYAPLRRILPPVGGLDFSPLVLLVILQLLEQLLIGFLR